MRFSQRIVARLRHSNPDQLAPRTVFLRIAHTQPLVRALRTMHARHLKEEDELVTLVRSRVVLPGAASVAVADASTTSVEAAFASVGELLVEHHACGSSPSTSRLHALCPSVGRVFVPLDVPGALREYDRGTAITRRRFVVPSFREVREVLNLAVTHAVAPIVRLVTLDADDTIYSDRGSLTADSPVIPLICALLAGGVHVSLVTAAAYPGEPQKVRAARGRRLRRPWCRVRSRS